MYLRKLQIEDPVKFNTFRRNNPELFKKKKLLCSAKVPKAIPREFYFTIDEVNKINNIIEDALSRNPHIDPIVFRNELEKQLQKKYSTVPFTFKREKKDNIEPIYSTNLYLPEYSWPIHAERILELPEYQFPGEISTCTENRRNLRNLQERFENLTREPNYCNYEQRLKNLRR